MDFTEGLVRELKQKAKENEDDPQALLEILYDLTTWSNDDIAELQKWIIEQVSEDLDSSLTRSPIEVPAGDGSVDSDEWSDVGLLGSLGYKVGKRGKPQFRRRAILRLAFRCEADEYLPESEAEKWEAPESPGRLQRMANSLSAFASNARRNSGSYDTAISHWEQDLQFLKEEYPETGSRVDWPSVSSSTGDNGEEKGPATGDLFS